MTELQTLKDLKGVPYFRFKAGNQNDAELLGNLISKEALYQEATKWVKIWLLDYGDPLRSDPAFQGGLAARISWVKLFFNLTEEDLK